MGTKLTNGNLEHVTFRDCSLDYALFRFSKLKHIRFEKCVLTDADFQAAELSDVSFIDCSLLNVEFSHAKLKDIDFSGSKLDGMHATPEQLRGSTIDFSQVTHFIQLMGIKIK
jgi:uncharacterized protein YjbI with pentapeptide repeats